MNDDLMPPEGEAVPEGWYPDPEDQTGKWLHYWDGEDWSDVPGKLASKKERESFVWPATPQAHSLDEIAEVQLDDLLLLGGSGFPLRLMSRFELVFGLADASVRGPGQDGIQTITIPYSDLTDLSIEGPGEIQEGGGFIGGGFGIAGFVIGAMVASVLNELTTGNRVETLIGLQAGERELVFLCTSVEPSTLEIQLSRVRGLLRSSMPSGRGEADLAAQLTRLADLVERGFLERDEFDRLKRRIIGDA